MTEQATKFTPGPWLHVRSTSEPEFWMRDPLPHELDGFDPLTGMIVAHSRDETHALDRKARGEQ